MTENKSVADFTFIGSGIATCYTLLKLLEKLPETYSFNPLKINVIEKYPEFFYGIPYGKRSGKSVLLINSLRSFLPDKERSVFIEWLKKNKNRLLEGYLDAGGEESKRWIVNNAKDINSDLWDDLFIPRSFFGEYIHNKVNESIKLSELQGLIKINYVVDEVIDLKKHIDYTEVKLNSGVSLFTEKNILSIGSLPTRKIQLNEEQVSDPNFLLVNDIYNEDIDTNFNKIESFILNRKTKETNVLIIGANASSLETIYKLNNKKEVNDSITNYIILSTHGLMPDSEVNESLRKQFIPKNLMGLKTQNNITAKNIADAAFKDIDLAENIKLGAASSVNIISKAFGSLLKKLSNHELEIFACKYGNEIGRRQRCAGVHYTSVVEKLRKSSKFVHIAGRYSNIFKNDDANYKFEYLDSNDSKQYTFPQNIHLVINCIGSINLEHENAPVLLKNLIANKYVVVNNSKIGLKVNDTFEASENLYISGPLLAGNVINGIPLWHLEHCGRIIWTSNQVGECLIPNDDNNIEIITDKDGWNNFLSSTNHYDFYHTYEYHQISKDKTDCPVLIKYKKDDVTIGLPLLIRKVKGTSYYDATSVYGYSGPISSGPIKKHHLILYKEALLKYFLQEKIVSVFLRLHPYLPYQNIIFHGFGELTYLGKVININLTLNLEEQRQKYHRRLKNHVNKANRECTVKKAVTAEDFDIFKKLYFENMDRVDAKDFYYFDDKYFEKFNNSKDFKAETLLAFHNETGKPIAGCIFVKTNNMVQYHLSGACKEYLHLNANKLLIDTMRIEATHAGFETFNLGGGLGANENDSLFRFKSSFSDEYHHFFVWKLIVNQSKYNELCTKNNVSKNTSNFFPLYRSDEFNLKEV